MGINQMILSWGSPGRKLKKSKWRYARAVADKQISDVRSAIANRERETPREQAHLKQSMWGRGLGKSSIFSQDKDRLTWQQEQQMKSLKYAAHVAYRYKTYVKRQIDYERKSVYAQYLDELGNIIMSIFSRGMSTNANPTSDTSGNQFSGMQQQGASSGQQYNAYMQYTYGTGGGR